MRIAAYLALSCLALAATARSSYPASLFSMPASAKSLPGAAVGSLGAFVYQLVILSKPVKARSLSGVVVDPSGGLVSGATVDLVNCPTGWPYGTTRTTKTLASTMTNSRGEFSFNRRGFKAPYCLHFLAPGFNPLEFQVKLTPLVGKMYVKLPIGG